MDRDRHGVTCLGRRAPPVGSSLTAAQRTTLYGIARDNWRFYRDNVDPVTHLPAPS